MSNKLKRLMEIKKEREMYCNGSVTVCVAGIAGILFSPTIPITCIILACSASLSIFGLKKMEKLNAEEKMLDITK